MKQTNDFIDTGTILIIYIFQRGRCLAVVFGTNHEVLYLMSETSQMRDDWIKGLRFALHMDQYMDQKQQTDRYPFHDFPPSFPIIHLTLVIKFLKPPYLYTVNMKLCLIRIHAFIYNH